MRLFPPRCSKGGRCKIRTGRFTLYVGRNTRKEARMPVTMKKCVKCGTAYGKPKKQGRHER